MLGYKITWHNRHGGKHQRVDKGIACERVGIICTDKRIRSCHVLAFPLEWRNATPLSRIHFTITFTFYPCRRSTYVLPGYRLRCFPANPAAFIPVALGAHRKEPRIAVARIVPNRSHGSQRFFPLSRHSAHFTIYTRYPRNDRVNADR